MKKGAFESQQILLMFEIIFALVITLTFYISVQGPDPSQFQDIDKDLTKTALLQGKQLYQEVQEVEREPIEKVSAQRRLFG